LWSKVVELAHQEVPAAKAYQMLNIGQSGLVQKKADFIAIYPRLVEQPLFAAQLVLNTRRAEFQQAIHDAMLAVDPGGSDERTDELYDLIGEFEKGSFGALLKCIDTISVTRPTYAEELTRTARSLHPRPYAQLDAKTAADKQLALQLEPQLDPAAPALP
jgi:hypothetical protein